MHKVESNDVSWRVFSIDDAKIIEMENNCKNVWLKTGVASAGGIIFFHEGHLETTFALRNSTNNQAEAYALLQGLLSVNEARVKTLIAINGSSMIINLMTSKKTPTDSKLAFLIAWIQKEVCKFQKVSFL